MTTIHVIKGTSKEHAVVLDEYFRLRHEVFVGERGWKDLAHPDGRDIDVYDNPNATYLIAIDRAQVVGGLRLYPTTQPHMISDCFPFLVKEGRIVSGNSILECTRYFVIKERRTGRTDCRLLAAFQEYCLEEGIAEVTAVVEMWWLPRWQQAGFKVRPLGLPRLIEGQPCIAAAIQISHDSLQYIRRLAGLRTSCLMREDATSSLDQVPYVAA
jgi:acyl-homoserine lactone synthase